jgi:hypothetical protein
LRKALGQVAFEVHRDQAEPRGEADIPARHLADALYQRVRHVPDRPDPYRIVEGRERAMSWSR